MGKGSKREKKRQTTSGKSGRPSGPVAQGGGSGLPVSDHEKHRLRIAGHVALQVVLATVIFLQVNYLSCRRYQTVDLSQNRKFTLSETTSGYLGTLTSKVNIVMAFLETSELYSDVKGLVSEYDRVGGDFVTSEYLDLSRSRERIADLKDRHGLSFNRDQIVILSDSGRVKTLAADEFVTRDNAAGGRVVEFRGEEVLTAALLEVTEQQQRKIYLLTGDRRFDEISRIAEQLQPLTNAQNARLESFSLEGATAIPLDADALILPGNSEDLTSREVDLVRDFWIRKKGGLVILLDPSAEAPNLAAFLREHGVAPRDDRVLSVVSIPGVAARKATDVPVTLMPGDGPTRDLPAMTLRLTGMTQSLGVQYGDDLLLSENIRPFPLMLAADGFWGEADYQAADVGYNPDFDHGRPDPVFVAASVERGEPADPSLEKGSSRLVVVGNPDLIDPRGNTAKVGADFLMASLNWTIGREELMGISPRRPTTFTLDISPADFGFLQSLMIFMMPLAALIAGGFVWFRRRA